MSGMRCAQLVETEKPLVLCDQQIPDSPPQGLVVRTAFAGVCHSDLHAQDDKIFLGGEKVFKFTSLPNFNLPVVMGHEIAGVVHSLGTDPQDGAPKLEVGDRVLVYPWVGCNKTDCGYCANGAGNLCTGLSNTIGYLAPGGYSTHVPVIDRKYVIKVPDNVPLDLASMLPCSGLTAYHAVQSGRPTIEQLTKYKGGASVLVIGAGGLGMWYLQLAKAVLPSTTRIIYADMSQEKLDTVKANGADRTVLWDGSDEATLIATAKQEGINNCIDVTVDFVNSSVTAQRANSCLGKSGVMVCCGLFGGAFGISLPMIAMQTRRIFGCYVDTMPSLQDLINLVAEKQVKPPPIEHIGIEGINNAFDRLRNGQINGRCLIKFS